MLEPEHFYLFPSTLPFIIRQDPEDRLDHLYYNFMMNKSLFSLEPLVFTKEDHPMIAPALELMKASAVAFRDSGKDPELLGAVVSALESFLSLVLSIRPPVELSDREISSAIEYIETHYGDELTVADLAAGAYLSEDHFIRRFKRAVGMTPYAYIRNLRISLARELRESGLSLTEASATVGFKHPSSYCRALGSQKR